MWSRKPTPVDAETSPPSRSSETETWVSWVLREISAVRLMMLKVVSKAPANCESSRIRPLPGLGRLPVHGKALRARQGADVRSQGAGGGIAQGDDGGPPAEGPRPQRAAEAGGAPGREHVVRPRRVVAERRPARVPHEHAARDSRARGSFVGAVEGKLQVLRRHRVGECQRGLEPPRRNQGKRRLGDGRALGYEDRDQFSDPVQKRWVG